MTALCRDIFRTEGADSFGHGPAARFRGIGMHSTGASLVLCIAIIAFLFVAYKLRGRFGGRGTNDVEFSRVSNEENLTI